MVNQKGAISPRAILVVLGLIFFVPLSVAWMMYAGIIDFRPGMGVNKGNLIQPPVTARLPDTFTSLDLNERWVLVYPVPAVCSESCLEFIVGLRQFHRALGRDSGRVGLVLLGEQATKGVSEEAEKIYPEFNVISENTGMLSQQLEELAGGTGVFIIDPLGNIMMHYPPDPEPDEILVDMERLLQYAKTDRR